MDVLSRFLQYKVNLGQINGVKLARNAPSMTNLLFADDLILMGQATVQEASCILQTLQAFCKASGQRVGPEKSRLWFSKVTLPQTMLCIMQIFQAPMASNKDVYLGVPLLATKQDHFSQLIDRLQVRLNGWKTGMLSHAGKLVLVRSVLEALAQYTMSTTQLPKSVLNQISSLIRRFFWGKLGNERYRPVIGWDRITKPKHKGGLGIRDIECLKKAFIFKILWKFLQQPELPWVQILNSIWHNTRKSNCSRLWKALLQVRHLMAPHLKTILGDLASPAFSNPWHNFWLQLEPSSAQHRRLCIRDLVDQHSGEWKTQSLISTFMFHIALYIAITFPTPISLGVSDRVVFTKAGHGCYTVKIGYILLREQKSGIANGSSAFWKIIWQQTDVIPRIQMFLWRIAQGDLPVGVSWAQQMGLPLPPCAVCGFDTDSDMHVLFSLSICKSCVAVLSSRYSFRCIAV
jgi:zinc-binding in reverse transcriptase